VALREYDTRQAPTRRRWRGCGLMTLAFALAIAVGVVVAFKLVGNVFSPSASCTATTTDGTVSLDPAQAADAATISAVGLARGLPHYAVTIALATAMQESKLYNLPGGDRDSIGLFQQRPSEGWGTAQQISDPVYASGAFYTALVKVDGYRNLPLAVAAQDVQHSSDGSLYAPHQADATVLSDAFTGDSAAALTCTLTTTSAPKQSAGGDGLTARADAVKSALVNAFTYGTIGNYASDGTGFEVTPTAAQGRSVTQWGWAYAQWAVAHSNDLAIGQVVYGGKVWSITNGSAGWQSWSGADYGSRVHIAVVNS
jgi:hypothetical protein